jgi:hypothetical protein
MGKHEVLTHLGTALSDPGSLKSGEYLLRQAVARAKGALGEGDRTGLIEALREWLAEYSEPRTMLAVDLAKELRLVELRPDLENLRTAIVENRAFRAFYVRRVDAALLVLR